MKILIQQQLKYLVVGALATINELLDQLSLLKVEDLNKICYVKERDISSLAGLEYFSGLKVLYCFENQLQGKNSAVLP
jgi:hypothetical protein